MNWEQELAIAIRHFTDLVSSESDHSLRTPERVVQAFNSMTEGYSQNPHEILDTCFSDVGCDQVVSRSGIRVVSTCEHHLLPFIGKANFSYLPDNKIVGISKIPRLVNVYSRRLQVQERLTNQIVDAFQDIVQPKGCALIIKAYHFCEIVRGAREHSALTSTVALRGCFKTDPLIREEFMAGINPGEVVFP